VQDTEQWTAGLLTLQFITRHVNSKTQVKWRCIENLTDPTVTQTEDRLGKYLLFNISPTLLENHTSKAH